MLVVVSLRHFMLPFLSPPSAFVIREKLFTHALDISFLFGELTKFV